MGNGHGLIRQQITSARGAKISRRLEKLVGKNEPWGR